MSDGDKNLEYFMGPAYWLHCSRFIVWQGAMMTLLLLSETCTMLGASPERVRGGTETVT